jgi:TP901 family phage tail tape measure protein
MAGQLKIPAIFTAVDKFTKVTATMGRGVQNFATKTEIAVARADRAFTKVMSPISRVKNAIGGLGLALGGAALIGGVISVVGIFKDFEQSNANLAAVMGKTKTEIVALSDDAKRLGASTAFTASQVSGLQTEFAKLGFKEEEILGATEATLSLAAATGTELPQAAAQVGAALRAFGLDADEATRVSNVFAAATSKSALDMSKLETGISTVAPVAAKFGFSIEDTTALLGKLSDAGFDASSAATATRNIILNLADSNGKLAKALGGPVNSLDDMVNGMVNLDKKGVDLAKMLELTDKRSVAAFATFVDGADAVGGLSKELQAAEGFADQMAKTQLDTLGGSITILQSAYEGFVLSLEDGTGAMSQNIRFVVEVATEMFNLGSGTALATEELDKGQKVVRKWAERSIVALKILGYITAGLVAWKIALIAAKVVMVGYNIGLGIMGALSGTASIAIGKNTVALYSYKIASALASAATWAFGAALSVGLWPITLTVAAIAALVAIVTTVVKKWDDWGAAVSLFLGPLGLVISLIQSFRRNWDMISEAFSSGGIIAGLKAIGVTLLDAVLMPLQQILEIASNIPGGVGAFAADGAERIRSFREGLGATIEPVEAADPEAERQEALTRRIESTQNQNVTIDVNGNEQTSVNSTPGPVPVNLSSTWQ